MNTIQKENLFEQECFQWLSRQGFENLEYTKINSDYGADIIGFYKGNKYVIECKNHEQKQGVKAVQAVVYSKAYYKATRAIVMSKSEFTNNAKKLANLNFVLLISQKELLHSNFEELKCQLWKTEIDAQFNIDDFKILLEEYENTKNELGYAPTLANMSPSWNYKVRKMGGIKKFLEQIGDSPKNSKPTNDILKFEYIRIRNKIGKVPTLKEIKEHTTLKSINAFHEYPLSKLQKECGDIPNCDRSYTKDDFIDYYFELSKKIGHPASPTDLEGKQMARCRRLFGSFKIFCDKMNIKYVDSYKIKVINPNDYIKILKLINELLIITNITHEIQYNDLKKLKYDNKPIVNIDTISKKFKGWNNIKKILENKDS